MSDSNWPYERDSTLAGGSGLLGHTHKVTPDLERTRNVRWRTVGLCSSCYSHRVARSSTQWGTNMNTADLSDEQRTILAQVTHLLIQQSLHISDDLFHQVPRISEGLRPARRLGRVLAQVSWHERSLWTRFAPSCWGFRKFILRPFDSGHVDKQIGIFWNFWVLIIGRVTAHWKCSSVELKFKSVSL